MKLVEGDRPTVVKEDQDLIIFEDVDNQPDQEGNTAGEAAAHGETPTPGKPQIPPSQSTPMQAPVPIMRTPRRRSAPSLHRAVLIRSAQRAAQRQELHSQSTLGDDAQIFEDDEYREIGEDGGEDGENYHDLDEEYEEMNLAEDDMKEEEEVEEAVSGEFAGLYDGEDQDEEEEEEIENTGSKGILAPLGHMLRSFAMDSKSDQEGNEVDITEVCIFYYRLSCPYSSSGQATDENDERGLDEQESHIITTPGPSSRLRKFGPFLTPQLRFGGLFGGSDDSKTSKEKSRPQRPPPGMRFSLGGPGLVSGFSDIRQNLSTRLMGDLETVEGVVPVRDEESRVENNQRSPTRPEVTEEERRVSLTL